MNRPVLTQRSTRPELMDTECFSFEAFHEYLQDLERINIRTLAYRPTLRWLNQQIAHISEPRIISILDVGSGNGDMLRRIATWAQKQDIKVDLIGVDLNPLSRKSAVLAAPADTSIQFKTANIFDFHPERPVDFIISSLFTHHLSNEENIRFLDWMEKHAVHGWFINDLHRHPVPYFFIKFATRLLYSNSPVMHDGPLSVARAYTADDWKFLLDKAKIPLAQTQGGWFFPFRYCVARSKQTFSL